MTAFKYAEALGSGMGILSGFRSWAGIQNFEEEHSLATRHIPAGAEDCEEADRNSIWVAMGTAALRARVRKGNVTSGSHAGNPV